MGVRHSSSHGLLCAYWLGMSLAIGKFHIVISSDGFWCSWLTLKGGIVTPFPSEQSRWASYRVTVGDWSQRRVRAGVRCRLCYIFSSVALVGVPGVHIPWIRVLLFAGEQLSRFPLLRKLLFPSDVLSFDGCVSDTLGTAVKIGTWWNSANTGSRHSWKDSWALVPHSEPQLESVALVWLLFSTILIYLSPNF